VEVVRRKRKPNKIKQFVCEKCNSKYELLKTPNKGRPKLCKPCLQEGVRERARAAKYHKRTKYKIKQRKWNLKTHYNLSMDDYENMVKRQSGVCAVCKKDNGKRPLVVDHSHTLNKVRGLLCDKCNRAIGAFDDDPIMLQSAISYLIRE